MPTNLFEQAKKNKADEFYTQLPDIEAEMRHYREQFRGKAVFCNCDDPFEDNFFKYFQKSILPGKSHGLWITGAVVRTDYFIGYGGLPAKVIYGGGRIEILSYDFDTGDFVANRMSMATLYMSQDDIERVSEPEFEAYVANLRELCHLEVPRYYIIGKLPVKALPVNDRFPDVRKFSIETGEFDVICLSYINLVGLSGEIGRVTVDEFERSLAEIRAWAAQLPSPGYYIINRQPVKLVRTEDGNPKLLGYIGRKDSFIPSEWLWRNLIPPVDSQWVCQVSETEFCQRVEAERSKFQERQQNPLTGDEQMKADRE